METRTRPGWLDPELYPFADRWCDLDGHRIHYVDEGAGPTLLLLHGNPTWSFLYRGVIEALSDEFRCVAPDLPGFGLSQPAWNYAGRPAEHAGVLEKLVLELDLRDAVVMLHDWGGPIGLAALGRHPERVRGLVVGNTWAWPVSHDPYFRAFSTMFGGIVGRSVIRWTNAFAAGLLPAMLQRRDATVLKHYRAPFRNPEDRRFTAVLPRAIARADDLLTEASQAVVTFSDRPALIVWGTRDPAFRKRERRRFENAFVDHDTVLLEQAGHYLQEDAPTEVADAIRSWYRDRFA